MFIEFFVAGPIATHFLGLGLVLRYGIPIHLFNITFLLLKLVSERATWRMRWSEFSALTFECIVCPGIFVNICRRITLSYVRVPGDVIAYAIVQGGTRSTCLIQRQLDLYLDDLCDQEELTIEDRYKIDIYRGRIAETMAGNG
jgi:hypothetical protein